MDNALGEITLVFFTTLSPAGALALVFIAFILLFDKLDRERFERLSHYTVVPLAVTIVGLVSSATHLGTPNHALYVLLGVGRSPLSNEVVAAVLFLMLGGLYWLFTFMETPHPRIERIWQLAVCLSALLFVFMVGRAYWVETVPTWHMIYGPLSMWCNGILSGTLLAIAVMHLADIKGFIRYRWALVLLSAAALVAGLVVLLIERDALGFIVGPYGTAAELMPQFPLAIVLFVSFGLVGIVLSTRSLFLTGTRQMLLSIAGPILALCGSFVVRFVFYALYMSVGLQPPS